MCDKVKQSISELLLEAVSLLQRKNGVSAMQIAEYLGEQKKCNPCKMLGPIRQVLLKAKEQGIMSECKGMYRLESQFEDKFQIGDVKPKSLDDTEVDDGKSDENAACIAVESNKDNSAEPEQCDDDKDKDDECNDDNESMCNDDGMSAVKRRKVLFCGDVSGVRDRCVLNQIRSNEKRK